MLVMITLIGSSQANPTLALPFWMGSSYAKNQIIATERMTMLAVGRRIFDRVKRAMSFAKNWLKMIRVAAGSVFAGVMEDFFCFELKKLKNYSMEDAIFTFPHHSAVPVLSSSGPHPTIGGKVNSFQDACWEHLEKYTRLRGMQI